MVRSELIASLTEYYPDVPKATIEKAVFTIFDRIVEQLAAGGRVEIRGFGTFTTRVHGTRVGRNPRTGDAVDVPAKHVPYFKPGKEMRDRVNR